MEQVFMTNVTIEKVRHLKDISVPLSEEKKHLILTGKNGSGKTSVLEALARYLSKVFSDEYFVEKEEILENAKQKRDQAVKNGKDEGEIVRLKQKVQEKEKNLRDSRNGLRVEFNHGTRSVYGLNKKYHYVLAYYRADRVFKAIQPKHVEKVQLKEQYGMEEFPRNEFVQYLLDLKMTEALARSNQKTEKADKICGWFQKLEERLKKIFDDETLQLVFDEETFEFNLKQEGREPFDFNSLSSGYQAVLDIVVDIMMRMESRLDRSFVFTVPGIVLIDEIETHLHLELQKNIMPLLTDLFPNIQFIVSSHSPFILNSLDNAVIYDLENHKLVENGLGNVPYDEIVEGYFNRT